MMSVAEASRKYRMYHQAGTAAWRTIRNTTRDKASGTHERVAKTAPGARERQKASGESTDPGHLSRLFLGGEKHEREKTTERSDPKTFAGTDRPHPRPSSERA